MEKIKTLLADKEVSSEKRGERKQKKPSRTTMRYKPRSSILKRSIPCGRKGGG
jgi:hypothetical protein